MAVANPERYASSDNLSAIFTKIETKLQNRYTKAQTDAAIASAIAGVTQFDYVIVNELPQIGTKGTIYLLPNSGTGTNLYNEYIWIIVEEAGVPTGHFEIFGSRELDVSGKLENADVKADGTYVIKTNDQSGNGFTISLSAAVVASLGLADTAVQPADIAGFLEGSDVKTDSSIAKTADQSGNGFTLGVALESSGQSGLTIESGNDPVYGTGLRVKVDNSTIEIDSNGALKVSDDFQTDVESLTTEQVNTLKAIFTDDASASGNGD